MFDSNFKNIRAGINLSILVKARLWVALPAILLSACSLTKEVYVLAPPPPVPIMPQPMAPAEGRNLSQFDKVVFSWRAETHAARYEFHVFNEVNNDMHRYLLTDLRPDKICNGDICSISLRLEMPESSRHAWRVRAVNESGSSQWTRTLFSWTN